MTPIVLGTNPERGLYVENFMAKVPKFFRDYIYVSETWDMELGAIRDGANRFDRFAFLQDTMEVHNWIMFMDAIGRHHTAYIIPRPSCYAMVYDSELVFRALLTVGMPGQDKELAIMGETLFCDQYEYLASRYYHGGGNLPVLYPEMTDKEALDAIRFDYRWSSTSEPSGGPVKPRLHLRSGDGTLSKYKATYR